MQNNARTHRSTPCAGREAFGNQRELVRKRDLASRGGRSPLPTGGRSRLVCPRRRGEVTPPYGCNTGSAKQRADVPKAWLPPTKFRAEIWGVSHRHRPLRKGEKAASTTRASGAQRSVCGAGAKKWVGIAAEFTPKVASNFGQSLSQPAADSSLYTREPLGTGDADCRVASLLAMTVLILCHSEEAQRADVGIRPFSDGRGLGPPYLGHGLRRPNFVPKFGASVRSSAPMESPSQPARSEASAPAAARDGRESAQEPSQKEDRPRDHSGSA